jgi:hypothetical protein
MPGRSQRHMIEHSDIFSADASGRFRPRRVSDIPNQTTNTTATLATATRFSGYPGLIYSATGLPTGKTINASTGLISGTSSTGSFLNCRVTVRNSYGQVASNIFTWTVA